MRIAYNERVFDEGLDRKMKIYDKLEKNITWIMVVGILAIALVFFVLSQFMTDDSDLLMVLVDGHEQGTYSLHENRDIRIETERGYNLLVIKDGQAYVAEADCDNQVCVHTQPVRESGGQIICLPHRVVIRLKTIEKSEIDAATN